MSKPSTGAADSPSCDADILAEISALLQDCACLHYALTEVIEDVQRKAAAAQSSAHYNVLSAQLRAHSASLGAVSSIRDIDSPALSHRAPALKALAHADHASAIHHIELCDAEALRLIGQRCCTAGLSAETQSVLLMVHRILRQASLSGSLARGPAPSSS